MCHKRSGFDYMCLALSDTSLVFVVIRILCSYLYVSLIVFLVLRVLSYKALVFLVIRVLCSCVRVLCS